MFNRWLIYLVSAIALVVLTGMCPYPGACSYPEDNGLPSITTFDQARDIAIKEGKDVEELAQIPNPEIPGAFTEIKVMCKVYKVAGLGQAGWWTFYTIKYSPDFKSIIIIIYKPEGGSLIILRKDTDMNGQEDCEFVIEEQHTTITWIFYSIAPKDGDILLKMLLEPMASLNTRPAWSFEPTDDMRHGDCWHVDATPVDEGGAK